MTRYAVSRVALASVARDVMRIWGTNLPVLGAIDAKLRWLYRDAPEPANDVYVLAADEELVGTAGLAVRRFDGLGRDLRVALGCDLAIDRPHRVVLPALRLVQEVRRDARATYDVVYNFPNELARGLYARAGYHDLGVMMRYVRVLRAESYVTRYVDNARLARAIGAAIDVALAAWQLPAVLAARHRYRLAWLDAVDDRFDALWDAARGAYPLVSRRDASWLRWRCLDSPSGRGRIATLCERGTGELHAYAVVHHGAGVAHITDLFGRPLALGPLLALVCAELRLTAATSVSIRYLGSPRVVAVLARNGFRRRVSDRHVYVATGDTLAAAERVRVLDTASWHLTDYDEDT